MKSTLTMLTTLLAVASLTLGCGSKPATGDNADKGDKGGSAALVAESEQDKAFLAWKEDACKCTDLACASQAADKRLALEKKWPKAPQEKNSAAIITAANACLKKAMGQ